VAALTVYDMCKAVDKWHGGRRGAPAGEARRAFGVTGSAEEGAMLTRAVLRQRSASGSAGLRTGEMAWDDSAVHGHRRNWWQRLEREIAGLRPTLLLAEKHAWWR
jgi:hypothetical protein